MEFTDQDGFTEHYLRELEALRKDGRDLRNAIRRSPAG